MQRWYRLLEAACRVIQTGRRNGTCIMIRKKRKNSGANATTKMMKLLCGIFMGIGGIFSCIRHHFYGNRSIRL